MRFRTWLAEGETDTLTLYHGTSSGFLPEIRKVGLVPAPTDVMTSLRQWFGRYFPGEELPEELIERASRSVSIGDVSGVIHLTPRIESAKGYARTLYKFGGENAYIFWKWFNDWKCGGAVCVEPIFANERPVVLEVSVSPSQVRKKNSDEYLAEQAIPPHQITLLER